jgi:hypothetical protein
MRSLFRPARLLVPAGLLLLAFGLGWLAGRLGERPGAKADSPTPAANGDVNADGAIDLGDPVYLLTYLFLDGQPPVAFPVAPSQTLTALIVRHCEKGTGTDPGLTTKGQAQAAHLTDILARARIDAVLSSSYNRTIQTVQGAADARGLPVVTFPDADIPEKLVASLRAMPPGSTALVAGNSFNLSNIVKALGVPEGVTVGTEEYDNLWVVRFGATADVPGAIIHLRH